MRFTTEDGKVWDWRGEYRKPKQGGFYLTGDLGGQIKKAFEGWIAGPARGILHPMRRIYTFGGVIFEETGEVRNPQFGEWILRHQGFGVLAPAPCCENFCDISYPILKPIGLVGEEVCNCPTE